MTQVSGDRRERVDAFCIPALDNATVLRADYRRQRFAPHSHATYVVALVTRGALRFNCVGQEWIAPANSICLTNPEEIQTGEGAAVDGWSYWCAYVPVSAFVSVGESLQLSRRIPFFPTRVLQDEVALAVLELFFTNVCNTRLPLAQSEQSFDCLTFLLERFYEADTRFCARREPRLVSSVKDYLAAHFSESVSLDDLSALTGVTGFHLTRLFKSTTGLALHAWLVQFRVERVQEMLRNGIPASEAATACGFSDQPHMARWLRRLSGMTPREVQSMSKTFDIGKTRSSAITR